MLDMLVPEIGGEETLYELTKVNPEVKVLLVSGFGAIDKTPKVVSQGFVKYIQKPFGEKTLSEKLREAFI